MDRFSMKYILDMYNCIESIDEFFVKEEKSLSNYNTNKILRLAIERNFEIIGEAANKLNKHNPNVEITNIKKMISLRNLLIHSYDNVTNSDIWNIIENHLPILKTELKVYLDKYPDL